MIVSKRATRRMVQPTSYKTVEPVVPFDWLRRASWAHMSTVISETESQLVRNLDYEIARIFK